MRNHRGKMLGLDMSRQNHLEKLFAKMKSESILFMWQTPSTLILMMDLIVTFKVICNLKGFQ